MSQVHRTGDVNAVNHDPLQPFRAVARDEFGNITHVLPAASEQEGLDALADLFIEMHNSGTL